MSKDYYKILGIDKSASSDEVKRAFRELAHKYHPDKANGDAEKFKEINEAYQVLGNSEKRKQYDQFGTTFSGAGSGFGGGGNPFEGFGGFNGAGINMEDLGDIFGDFFGMGRGSGARRTRTKQKTRGADIEMNLSIDFKESVLGAEKIIELYKNASCDHCGGAGAEPGSKINVCQECGGSGQVKKMQNMIFGSFQTVVTCPRCGGSGKIPEKLCRECGGAGVRKKSVSLKVNIPAGMEEGELLRVSGAGEAAPQGANGDLYIHINIKKHEKFSRQGENIIMRAPVDFKTAALGGYINIETLEGEMKIKIPEGTESGQIFRLRGKGVARRGDLLVEVYITVPKKLSKKQKKILDEWEE
ncbi:MAG: molecular chaperone DnaJ [Patescibacteria group bacterium]